MLNTLDGVPSSPARYMRQRCDANHNAVQALVARSSAHTGTDMETSPKYDVVHEVERLASRLGHQTDYFKKLKDLEDAAGTSTQLEAVIASKSGGEVIQVRVLSGP